MTFCKRRVCRASAKDELQTIGRPPGQLGGAGRSADCSQLYALQFYTARCKHSALRAPCSQRFTPESGALRPTLMPEASEKFRVEAATMVMQTLTDEDSLRLAATKLEACADSKTALKAAVEIAANDGNPAAAAVAREVYEFITGEEWPGASLARVKTITFKPDGESEDESP